MCLSSARGDLSHLPPSQCGNQSEFPGEPQLQLLFPSLSRHHLSDLPPRSQVSKLSPIKTLLLIILNLQDSKRACRRCSICPQMKEETELKHKERSGPDCSSLKLPETPCRAALEVFASLIPANTCDFTASSVLPRITPTRFNLSRKAFFGSLMDLGSHRRVFAVTDRDDMKV